MRYSSCYTLKIEHQYRGISDLTEIVMNPKRIQPNVATDIQLDSFLIR